MKNSKDEYYVYCITNVTPACDEDRQTGALKVMEQTSHTIKYVKWHIWEHMSGWFVFCFTEIKISNETQASDIFFFTLLVMLGNYESPCFVSIKLVTM